MDEPQAVLAGTIAVVAGFALVTCVIAWLYARCPDLPCDPWDDAPGDYPRDPRKRP